MNQIKRYIARIEELERAIRTHRDQRGDDRCWLDDETLYRVLPEGYTPYVSPQREIEQLEGTINALLRAIDQIK